MWLLALAFAVEPDPVRGEVLAGLAGCPSCHTAEGGPPYAGGYAIETEFGTFYGPNLTPDAETGVGQWGQDDFARALRHGKSPSGTPYWPAFPYTAYTAMSDEDVADLWAYLRTVAPVRAEDRPHELRGAAKGLASLRAWRSLEFRAGPWRARAREAADRAVLADPVWRRGAYLAAAVGHCQECHTPRNGIGGLRAGQWLAGNERPPEPAPNLTPHPENGLGNWTAADIDTLLTLGMTPDGDVVSGAMRRIVREGTALLSAEDRAAIVTYLQALRPRQGWRRAEAVEDEEDDDGDEW